MKLKLSISKLSLHVTNDFLSLSQLIVDLPSYITMYITHQTLSLLFHIVSEIFSKYFHPPTYPSTNYTNSFSLSHLKTSTSLQTWKSSSCRHTAAAAWATSCSSNPKRVATHLATNQLRYLSV